MDTLEQLLTDDLRAAAEAADLTPPDADDVLATVAHQRRRRRIRTGLAVAAAALVAAGTVSILTTDNPSRTDISDNPTTTTTQPDPTTTAPPTTTTPSTTTTTPPPVEPGIVPPASARPVAETIQLRAEGLGDFDFGSAGADAESVAAAVTAELGQPEYTSASMPAQLGCTEPQPNPSWQVSRDVTWPGLSLMFAGMDEGSLVLVGWHATTSLSAPRTLRVADGPTFDDPLGVWQEHYGSAMSVLGVDSQGWNDLTIELPGGTIQGSDSEGDADLAPRRVLFTDSGCHWGGD